MRAVENKKFFKAFINKGVPESVLLFLYNNERSLYEELVNHNGFVELNETSTTFSHMYYLKEYGPESYLAVKDSEIDEIYKKLLQKAQKYCEEKNLQR